MFKSKLLKLILLTMIFSVLFIGCASEELAPEIQEVEIQKEIGNVSLPFDVEAGFNPYIVNNILTKNNCGLIFVKALQIDSDFNVEYMAADTVSINGLNVTVVINDKYKFSNGSTVTAQDFEASLQAAMISEIYGGRFANIEEISSQGNVVNILLKEPDSLFHLLLDIPILRQEDVLLEKPMCSGRYKYGLSNTLVVNGVNDFNIPEHLSEIDLVAQGEYSALLSSLNIGTIDFLSSQNESDISSNTITVQSRYSTNNLIYLGFNSIESSYAIFDVDGVFVSYGDSSTVGERFFSNASARVAISELLNRRILAEKGYFGKANTATGIFNNAYTFLNITNVFNEQGDTNLAVNTINSLGYKYDETQSYYYDENDERLTLTLLCYAGNSYKRYTAQLIAEQLEAVGIDIIIDEEESFELYTEKVASGNFDMYIGEIKLYNNMDMSAFFTAGGSAANRLVASNSLLQAYSDFKLSADNAQAFQDQFAKEIPFAPILWYEDTVFYSKEYEGLEPSISDVFYNLQDVALRNDEEELTVE